jgi:hypothetical protein
MTQPSPAPSGLVSPLSTDAPAVGVADGHGMILSERRVDLEDATYRVV